MVTNAVEQIPSQCPTHYLEALTEVASVVKSGAVVECGAWLGASTAAIGVGLKRARASNQTLPEVPIHVYDYFKSRRHEIDKAANAGLALKHGEDTVERFMRYVLPVYQDVHPHPGSILNAKWDGTPISLYVDDACKIAPVFHHAMRTFGPSFIPGTTKLVLLDFNWILRNHRDESLYAYQSEFMERYALNFRRVRQDPATWLYVKTLDFSTIPEPSRTIAWAARARAIVKRMTGRFGYS